MRGASTSLGEAFIEHCERHGRPDAVVVSALMNVAAFGGVARHALTGVPLAAYFHENQLLYPDAPGQSSGDSMALINYESLVAADEVWFNSGFHRDALLGALDDLIARQPGEARTDVAAGLRAKATVLWPGVETQRLIDAPRSSGAIPLVVWNQRWDHDKNPDVVFNVLANLAAEGVPFELALAGENTGRSPAHENVQRTLGDVIVHDGWLDRDAYLALLLRSDVVVSATDHEFFGIAIVEALAAGATPVLPNRLSFPELIPAPWHDTALYGADELADRLRLVLSDTAAWRDRNAGLRESMRRFDIAASVAAHDAAINQLIASGSAPA